VNFCRQTKWRQWIWSTFWPIPFHFWRLCGFAVNLGINYLTTPTHRVITMYIYLNLHKFKWIFLINCLR
jgi:hypothetical protein